ncbi:hypothetical protein BPAE_0242g00080 [Botrytis paeoniae]|uniref:Uncharacterized protein n=1 Tax=Botrytis paeoniae TaxID=278948 RepID=A0A4Z1FE84_9HELO|nr:hypothetical protein BPAE_0242g00080 [Botrytis paeoniae]
MSPSKAFNNTPVNYPDVQPSSPPKPFTDQQPKANTIVFKSTLTEKCWIDVLPDARKSKLLGLMVWQEATRTEGVIDQ